MVHDRCITNRHGITGCSHAELRNGTDITGPELRNLDGFLAAENVDLTDLLSGFLIYVIDLSVRLQGTRANLHEGVFSEERIHDGLPYLRGQGCVRIILRSEALAIRYIDADGLELVRCREVLVDDLKKDIEALYVYAGAHEHRNHAAGLYVLTKCGLDLLDGELLTTEVLLHELVGGLCNGLQKSISCDTEVLLNVLWDLTRLILVRLRELTALHLYDVYEADKLLIFTDRDLERCDGTSELLLQI